MLETLAQIHDVGGDLENITCTLFEGRQEFVTAIGLRFESISVVFRANPDDDTLVASIDSLTPAANETLVDITHSSLWGTCVGANACWLWWLTNHQGYVDGVRLEFGADDQSNTIVELLVVASAIKTLVVDGAT